jgi:hypothetical protein
MFVCKAKKKAAPGRAAFDPSGSVSGYPPLTADLSAEPAENFGTFAAGI